MLPWLLLALRVVMAVTLLALVVVCARYAWRDATGTRTAAIPTLLISAFFAHGERSYRVSSEAWIGRDPNCLICLNDGLVSARHARLFFEAGRWHIADDESRNGTRLNDAPLGAAAAVALNDGDQITIGAIRMRVSASA
jgi:pSer/pThr/pTyr-binding forkhead associated (FHA) protein